MIFGLTPVSDPSFAFSEAQKPHHGEAGAFLARLDCGRLLELKGASLINTLTSAYKPSRRQG